MKVDDPTTIVKTNLVKRKKTTAADERALHREVKRASNTTQTKVKRLLSDCGSHVSWSTTWRRFGDRGCSSVKPRKVPFLTVRMKNQRLQFACQRAYWTMIVKKGTVIIFLKHCICF